MAARHRRGTVRGGGRVLIAVVLWERGRHICALRGGRRGGRGAWGGGGDLLGAYDL